MMNNILITGGKGFVGQHIMRLFPDAEMYDLKDGQDILDWNQLAKAVYGKDIIIHLAALISVNDSLRQPGKYYSTNIAGTDAILRAAVKAGCKTVIFASSAAVYAPNNPYGLSKKIGEDLMSEYRDKIQTISLRFFNIYGPNQNPEYAGVISKFLGFVKDKEPLRVTGDGSQTRDFISIFDIVNVIKKIIESRSEVASGSVFEVGTGKSVTINHLAEVFSDMANVPILRAPDDNVGILHSQADNHKLLEIIGDYPFISLREGVERLIKKIR